jgi:small-conductance mechanosensitive channel
MNPTSLSPWFDLWTDLHNPGVLWQIATVLVCLVLGWGLARPLRGRLTEHETHLAVVRFGMQSFTRVLWPFLAFVLMLAAKPILAHWHNVSLLRVAIPLVGSFALIRFAFHVMRRAFARGGKAGSFLLMFEKVFAIVVWFAVAMYITGLGPDVLQYLDDTTIPLGRSKTSVLTVLQALASVGLTLLVALWIGAMLEERLMRLESMHSSLRVVMARFGRACLILVAVLASLSMVGIDLTVLSVFGGALGVGLGLGLQKIVSSYFSGFVILLERSLTIGDSVTVDKYSGRVTHINTRYTVLRGLDGAKAVIPNEMLVNSPVQNFSLTDRRIRLSSLILIAYQSEVDPILGSLEQAVAGVSRVCPEPAPQVLLARFALEGIELEVGFWITDPENGRANVLSEVNRVVWRTLQEQGVQVPYLKPAPPAPAAMPSPPEPSADVGKETIKEQPSTEG